MFDSIPGAVREGDVIAHFGNPLIEQRQLAAGEALVPLTDRTLIEVAGADRLAWLDSFTSQALKGLPAGASTELLVLDPQGRVEHAAAVFEDGTATWLIADSADADALATWLQRMVFRSRVSVTVKSDAVLVGFFAGGGAQARVDVAAPNGHALVWNDPWQSVQPGGHQYAAVDGHPGADYAWTIAVLDDADALTGPFAGALAAEALRIAAWRPRWSHEVDERTIPHEADWIRSAVHLDKGCYRGQETVAKVHNLGHPPRRLAALHLDGSEVTLPQPGSPVLAGDAEVGQVTSAALHYEDGPIALAMLSRRAPIGDLVVRADGVDIAAAQQVIVPADAGATAEVPRLTRLSRRPLGEDPRNSR
ncbi:folate-binding protein YgfZ [Microbacterium esteraromaticum]|uniref:CAF17-like 4Fe-4S cluster assembly/insertion protein YgfZ n=1 Tax=Microbacterium esteraromaticum TaxID=57043 RepID=UPI003C30B619